MNKVLILIRGIPGSGKSTLAHKISAANTLSGVLTTVCEADQFMVNKKGDYEFKRERLKECHENCRLKARKAMEAGHCVIVSNTFIKRWEMEAYIDFAVEFGYSVQEIICNSNFGNNHGVPDEKVLNMKINFEF